MRFIGYKHAQLVVNASPGSLEVRFLPLVAHRVPYGVEAAAFTRSCEPLHYAGVAPVECGVGYCGFHALSNRQAIRTLSYSGAESAAVMRDSTVLLEVALFGTVVEGETGYRGGRQLVRRVTLPKRCHRCRHRTVAVNPSAFEDQVAVTACERHAEPNAVTLAELSAASGVAFELGEPFARRARTYAEAVQDLYEALEVTSAVAATSAIHITFFGLSWLTLGAAVSTVAAWLLARRRTSNRPARGLT